MIISVLGCGWLGFPLAQRLLDEAYTVKGSSTSDSKLSLLKLNRITPYHVELPGSFEDSSADDFWKCDLLFINVPPGRSDKEKLELYPSVISKVMEKAKENSVSWVIFASSTSVYGELGGLTEEEDTTPGNTSKPSGEILLKTEGYVKNNGIDYTILRFGGLYGYGRHPINYLSGKKGISDPAKPVNLVHQIDCINVVLEVIRQKARNEIYNVVSDGHPPRKEFYESAARHFNLPPPEFKNGKQKDYRIVSNAKLKKELKYSFLYPNPMDFTP